MRRLAGFVTLLAFSSAAPALADEAPGAKSPPAKSGAATTSVEEVVVTGETLPVQTLIDRKVYSIGNDLQATTGSAAELLNTVPSVTVDADGNVSLRGDGNVTILVDGKPSAQFSGANRGLSLQQFSASDIDRVEVLTTPPAQFKAEGTGGVINIITKKTRRPGLSGSGQFSLGDERRYVAGFSAAYNAGGLKLSGVLGLRQDARERVTTTNRVILDPVSGAAVTSQHSIDEHQKRLIPSVAASLDYHLNDRQSVGGSFSYRDLTGRRYFEQLDASGPAGGAITTQSERHDDGHDWSGASSGGLRFEQKLWRPHETLNLGLQQSADRERESNAYRNIFILPPSDPTFDDLHLSHDLVKTEFSADYDLPLPGDREIKLGYDFERDQDAFDQTGGDTDPATGESVENPDITNHFRYRQDVNAAYGEYQAPFGSWQVQAGVRLEAAKATFLQIIGNVPGGRSDSGAFPSLHLTHELGEMGKLSIGVSRRLSRPDPEILNPFVDRQDTHNLRAGNPNLAPQDAWSYEVGYNGAVKSASYGVTAYYRSSRNSITDIVRPVSDDVVLTTKANLPKSQSAGLEFSANGKIGRQLGYNFSGNLFAAQIDATALGAPGLKSTTGLNLKASLDWRPTAADTAQVSVTRQDKRLTPQGYIDAIDIVNVGYRHQLRPDLAAVATISDLFEGQKTRRLTTTPLLRDVYLRDQFGRIAYVGLVYTFGGQSKKPSGFDYQP